MYNSELAEFLYHHAQECTLYITAEFSAGTALTLKAAINELNPVCDKWYKIGVQLEVPIPNLRNIARDSMDPLCDTLDFWMRNGPSPSWRCLVDALKTPSVGEKQLAEEIERKYCSSENQTICVELGASVQAAYHQGTYVCIGMYV